ERHDVERAHVVAVGKEPARQVQAEKARAARDRPEHYLGTLLAVGGVGAGCTGGFAFTSTAAASRTDMPTRLSPTMLARRRGSTPPAATAGTATSLCRPPHANATATNPILTSRTWP